VDGLECKSINQLAFDGCTSELWIGDYDRLLRYDIVSKKRIDAWFPSTVQTTTFCLSNCGKFLFTSDEDGRNKVFDRATKACVLSFKAPCDDDFIVSRFAKNLPIVIAGGNSGSLLYLNIIEKTWFLVKGNGIGSVIRSVEYLSDDRLVTCGDDCKVRIWDVGAMKKSAVAIGK
jgi:WD40 repeat protein